VSVSAAELAARARRHGVRIDAKLAVYFLGYWLEHGIVVELLPGRYALTPKGERLASGLLTADDEERAA
jgi:hypothetical protein